MGQHKLKKKNKGAPPKPKGPTLADKADRHDLYQRAVQAPAADCEFITRIFGELRGRPPLRLREDFCGTALMARTWCEGDPARSAVGVDLDEATLAWGRVHNLEPAGAAVLSRVELVRGDVRAPAPGAPADVTCAMNFSFCVFKARAELRAYFEAARKGLAADGIWIGEIYGGTEAIDVLEEEREVGPYTYVWEQGRFDPITHDTTCHISFRMRDGSKIHHAFTYEWRLWTLPELREVLLEAGFRAVKFYFEELAPDEDDPDLLTGTGNFVDTASIDENQESWLAYVVALA